MGCLSGDFILFTIFCEIIMYYIVMYYIILSCIIWYCHILYDIVIYHIMIDYIILYYIMLLIYYIIIQYIMIHHITFVNSSFLMLNKFHSVLFSSLQFLSPLIYLPFYSNYILSHSIIFSCDKHFYLYFFPI